MMIDPENLHLSNKLISLLAEVDEFKGTLEKLSLGSRLRC